MRQLTTKPRDWFKIDNIREHYDDAEDRLLGESLLGWQIHPVIARPRRHHPRRRPPSPGSSAGRKGNARGSHHR